MSGKKPSKHDEKVTRKVEGDYDWRPFLENFHQHSQKKHSKVCSIHSKSVFFNTELCSNVVLLQLLILLFFSTTSNFHVFFCDILPCWSDVLDLTSPTCLMVVFVQYSRIFVLQVNRHLNTLFVCYCQGQYNFSVIILCTHIKILWSTQLFLHSTMSWITLN